MINKDNFMIRIYILALLLSISAIGCISNNTDNVPIDQLATPTYIPWWVN
jgi:hypothetical protein